MKSKTLIRLILLHYKSLNTTDIAYFQPPKELNESTWLLFIELSYAAQKAFAKHGWTIRLLGTNIRLNKFDAPKGTAPEMKSDMSPEALVTGTSNCQITPPE